MMECKEQLKDWYEIISTAYKIVLIVEGCRDYYRFVQTEEI